MQPGVADPRCLQQGLPRALVCSAIDRTAVRLGEDPIAFLRQWAGRFPFLFLRGPMFAQCLSSGAGMPTARLPARDSTSTSTRPPPCRFGHFTACRMQPDHRVEGRLACRLHGCLQGCLLGSFSPHAVGSAQPCCHVCRCSCLGVRNTPLSRSTRFHRNPSASPLRSPRASARANRTPCRWVAATPKRRCTSSTVNGSIS